MFFDTLDKLRNKPAPVKRSIAFGISLSITALVGVLWVISFYAYASESAKKGLFTGAVEPMQELSEKISGRIEDVNATTGRLKNEADNLYTLLESIQPATSSSGTSTLEEELIQ